MSIIPVTHKANREEGQDAHTFQNKVSCVHQPSKHCMACLMSMFIAAFIKITKTLARNVCRYRVLQCDMFEKEHHSMSIRMFIK